MDNNQIKLQPEVSHLSSEQIEELYAKYISGVKNSDLLVEFNIKTNPNKLINLIPPFILDDCLCPRCEVSMLRKRNSKSHTSNNPAECPVCSHKIFTDDFVYDYCRCSHCAQERIENARIKAVSDRAIVEEIFSLNAISPVPYSDLSFTFKILLLTLFRVHTDSQFDHILPLSDSARLEPLCPTSTLTHAFIEILSKQKVIVVDPKSKINAFDEENNFKSFYYNLVQWIPNVKIDSEERAALEDIHLKIYNELIVELKSEWEQDVSELIYSLAIEEVIQYLNLKADELKVDFSAQKKSREVIRILLESFSVSQIYYFVRKAVDSAHLYYSKGYSNGKKHAGNTIPNKMMMLGERAVRDKWTMYCSSRISSCPRCALSKTLFDVVLRDDDAGFTKSPGLYLKNELHSKLNQSESDSVNSEPKNGFICVDCSSTDIGVCMNEADISVLCNECGSINEYKAL
ncbi:hypothetical protein [Shewanella sp. SG41-3]|uniref:hypothetical protein n=1 Tax=Shewanella sp. SG41-3 TaxID=2760977 RepID=UPI001603DDA3|nr:hypothetical protein [Shewanella sp. SG41-3]MBB1475834.1 hypothetical protein [Shewanella sp. SG41-3]